MAKNARTQEGDWERRAREHRASRRAWQFLAYLLALVAGVCSGLVASELFAEGEGEFADLAPYLGAIATVAVVFSTVFNPQGKAADHKTARSGFANLARDLRTFHESTVLAGSFDKCETAFAALEATRRQLEEGSPEPGNYARWVSSRR